MKTLSDDRLLRGLFEVLRHTRHDEAGLVAHIGEVDVWRLYRREAAPSMFIYCTERLHLSEQEAYLRIAVARVSREHPVLLTMLRDGRLHLSGIGKLAPHLTPENRDGLLKQATHKSKREIERLVAALAPRPEAPAVVRRLPDRSADGAAAGARGAGPGLIPGSEPVLCRDPDSQASDGGDRSSLVPTTRLTSGLGPDRVPSPPQARPAAVESKAPDRFRVHFDASADLCEKLQRLRALLRRSRPDADLATIIEDAVTVKLERLEARRFGRTRKPRKSLDETDTAPRSRRIPGPIRRAVHERDGGRCTYTDDHGRRCPERDDLEFHHEETPFGKRGHHTPDNVRLMCRAHNLLRAEEEYGEEVMARFRRSGSRVSEPVAVYAVRLADRESPGRDYGPGAQRKLSTSTSSDARTGIPA